MKTTILTTTKINNRDLGELKDLIPGLEIYLETVNYQLRPRYNPYFNQIWGDFDLLRELFIDKTNIRCFCTTKANLQNIGITEHIGLYDNLDTDDVIDFYFGLPTKLDPRAIKNGFQSNFAWLFVHEMLHGKEILAKYRDRTHVMEEQGRLKELLAEHLERDKLAEKVSMLQQIYLLTLKLKNLIWYTKN